MVLGDKNGIGHPGFDRQPCPGFGVEVLERQQGKKVVETIDVPPTVAVVCEHFSQWCMWAARAIWVATKMLLVRVGILSDRAPRGHDREVGIDQQSISPLVPPPRHVHRLVSIAHWHTLCCFEVAA